MDKALLAEELARLNQQIFPFAFSLIYDELQAQQLIIDAQSVFLGRNQDALEDYLESEDEMSKRLKWFEISKVIYSNIYQIASKRFDQVRSSLSFDEKYTAFYALSLEQRAILFLKYKTDFEESDIYEILGRDFIEYSQLKATAEMNLSRNFDGEVLF